MKVKIKCPWYKDSCKMVRKNDVRDDKISCVYCRQMGCKDGIIEAELVDDTDELVNTITKLNELIAKQRAEFVKDLKELKNWIESMENPENEKAYIEDIDRLIAKVQRRLI